MVADPNTRPEGEEPKPKRGRGAAQRRPQGEMGEQVILSVEIIAAAETYLEHQEAAGQFNAAKKRLKGLLKVDNYAAGVYRLGATERVIEVTDLSSGGMVIGPWEAKGFRVS